MNQTEAGREGRRVGMYPIGIALASGASVADIARVRVKPSATPASAQKYASVAGTGRALQSAQTIRTSVRSHSCSGTRTVPCAAAMSQAARLMREKAATVINVKLMKFGLWHAREISWLARVAGVKLMIGGMMETSLAMTAATYDARVGRQWRALQDTTNDPIISQRRPKGWLSWQRNEDYYSEGQLIWLDVDTTIREKTGGRKSLDDFAKAGADVVMLDNFSLDDLRTAVALAKGRAVLEASGGVNLTTVRAIAETGVDVISVGALTHSAPVLDIGLDAV